MNIVFGTDGPIINTDKFELKYGPKYFKKKYIKDCYKNTKMKLKKSDINDFNVLKNPNGYGIKEKFGCTKEEEEEFWKKHILLYTFLNKPNNNSSKVLKQLKNEGDKLFNYTALGKTTEDNIKGITMRALLKIYYFVWRLKFDKTRYFNPENCDIEKSIACEEDQIDIIIDDKKETIEYINNNNPGTTAICFESENNQDYNPDLKAKNLHEVYRKIRNIKSNGIQFTFLSREERQYLSNDELLDYYKRMREYYVNSTHNIKTIEQKEKNYNLVVTCAKPVFDLFQNYEIINEDLIPKEDGFIVVINHRDYIDTPLVFSIIGKRPIHVISKIELLDEPLGKLLDFMGSISIKRGDDESERFGVDEAVRVLLKGKNVLIAPEGTRNSTEERLLKFKKGAVQIAQRSGKKIIGLAISKCGKDNKDRLVRICEPMKVNLNENLVEANDKLRSMMEKALIENENLINSNNHVHSIRKKLR